AGTAGSWLYRQPEGEFVRSAIEETTDATLDATGQLRLSHPPQLPPGPVRVTIRVAAAVGPRRGLADVIREIAAEQRARGFPGRSAEDLRAEDDARLAEDAERDRELDAARRGASSAAVNAVLLGYRDRYLRGRGWSRVPGNWGRSAEAVRVGRRPPSRRRDRVRL